MKNIFKSSIVVFGQMVIFNKAIQKDRALNSLINSPMLALLAFVGVYIVFNYVDKLNTKTSILQKIVSIFFAICTWFMTVYASGIDTVNEVIKSSVGVVYALLFTVSFYIMIEMIQKILVYFYYKDGESESESTFILFFDRHSFMVPFLILIITWGIISITAYPSTFMGDSLYQLEQFFSISPRSASHPVFSTLFIGSFVKIGTMIGNANLGLFLFTVFQLTFVSFCISLAISITYKLTNKSLLLIIISFVFAVIPMVNSSVILATKDIMFSGFFVLFMVSLITYFVDYDYFKKYRLYFLTCFSVFFMMLFRYNTLHFVALTIIVYVIGAIIMKKKFYKVTSVTLMMIVGLILGSGVNTVLSNSFGEEQVAPKRREMLSLPFQQTARYAKYHDNEVTPNEKEIINKVLDYDTIKKNYDPYRSDKVKRTHNEEATTKEMKDYFLVVKDQVFSHPLLAVESVMASHSNLFNLNQVQNNYYSTNLILYGNEGEIKHTKEIGIHDNQRSLKLNSIRVKLYRIFDRLPVLSQLDNYAFYVLIMLSVFVMWIRDKKYYLAGMVIPMGAFIGTLIAGPITLGYIRYILPIILVSPFLLVFCLSTKDKEVELQEETTRTRRRR